MIKRLALQDIQYINVFEKISRVRASDCFSYGAFLIFVVPHQDLSRAIGQNGINAKRLSELLKRKIKIIPGTDDEIEFVKALLYPIKYKEITFESGMIIIRAGPQSKALIIGRNSERLKELKEVLERYFKIDGIKVM
ncbi:MAG: NusA-like transcription termination signal-binding factor [Nanoarchaeota archaeon]